MRLIVFRRVLYYSLVLLVAVVAHQSLVADLFGDGVSRLLRRNSEAYVLMLLPLYWDVFVFRVDPDGNGATATVGGRRNISLHLVWFAVFLLGAGVVQVDATTSINDSLPAWLTTLGEAFLGIAVISAYLGWSRRLTSWSVRDVTGAPVAPARARAVYYALVFAIAVLAEQSWMINSLGSGLGSWLEINTEAYAAMLLIPAYFDVMVPIRRPRPHLIWYGALVAMPLLVQIALHIGLPPESIFAWVETLTEAFVATLVVSVYFDLVRGRWEHDGVSADEQAESGGE